MTPEERLCQRVLELSCSPIVPPAISARLGQAVARYQRETTPARGHIIMRAIGLGIAVALALALVVWLARLSQSRRSRADCADYDAPWMGRERCGPRVPDGP